MFFGQATINLALFRPFFYSFIFNFYFSVYPPDLQESNGGANT